MDDIQKTSDEIRAAIMEYANEHTDQLGQIAQDIDTIINDGVVAYDAAVDQIRESIINDPAEIADPEQEMRDRLAAKRVEIESGVQEKLRAYQEKLEAEVGTE